MCAGEREQSSPVHGDAEDYLHHVFASLTTVSGCLHHVFASLTTVSGCLHHVFASLTTVSGCMCGTAGSAQAVSKIWLRSSVKSSGVDMQPARSPLQTAKTHGLTQAPAWLGPHMVEALELVAAFPLGGCPACTSCWAVVGCLRRGAPWQAVLPARGTRAQASLACAHPMRLQNRLLAGRLVALMRSHSLPRTCCAAIHARLGFHVGWWLRKEALLSLGLVQAGSACSHTWVVRSRRGPWHPSVAFVYHPPAEGLGGCCALGQSCPRTLMGLPPVCLQLGQPPLPAACKTLMALAVCGLLSVCGCSRACAARVGHVGAWTPMTAQCMLDGPHAALRMAVTPVARTLDLRNTLHTPTKHPLQPSHTLLNTWGTLKIHRAPLCIHHTPCSTH